MKTRALTCTTRSTGPSEKDRRGLDDNRWSCVFLRCGAGIRGTSIKKAKKKGGNRSGKGTQPQCVWPETWSENRHPAKSVLCPRQLCHTDTAGCLSSVMPLSEEFVPCLTCNTTNSAQDLPTLHHSCDPRLHHGWAGCHPSSTAGTPHPLWASAYPGVSPATALKSSQRASQPQLPYKVEGTITSTDVLGKNLLISKQHCSDKDSPLNKTSGC